MSDQATSQQCDSPPSLQGVTLRPGDVFLSSNPMALGKIINLIQSISSVDSKSTYSHAGIITSESGDTLEAVWTVKAQNILKDYAGDRVVIARCPNMTPEKYEKGFKFIEKHIGQWYPAWRLFLMIIPPIGRRVSTGRVVCSELVCKFLVGSGAEPKLESWRGMNPDNIHDIVRNWKGWEIVFEGVV